MYPQYSTNPTPAQYLDWGMAPIPLRATGDTKAPRDRGWLSAGYTPQDWHGGEGIGLRCGLQPDGTYLYVADFDHRPAQAVDAPQEFATFLARLPAALRDQLTLAYSTSRRGRYAIFKSLDPVPSSWIRDTRGKGIGDFLGEGKQVVAPTPDRWIQGSLDVMPIIDDIGTQTILDALNYRAPVAAGTATIAWHALPDARAFLDRRKIPARLPSTCQAARVLLGHAPAKDTSHARYIVGYDLVRHGYTDDECAALLLHLCDWGTSTRKGQTWLERDIERIISKVRAEQPKAAQPPPAQPEQQPLVTAEGGRPRKLTLDAYRYYLRQNLTGPDRVLKSQADIADELGVSKRTVQRWEGQLRDQIERRITADGKHSYVVFVTHDKTDAPEQEGGTIGGVVPVTVPDLPLGQQCDAHEDLAPVASCWACGGPAAPDGAGIVRCVACGEVPVVARLVDAALEATDGQRHTDTRRRVVVAYVQASGRPDAAPDWIIELADELHRDRKQREADERFVAELCAMPDREVDRKLKAAERRQADEHSAGRPGAAWIHGRRAWFIRREWDKPERKARRDLAAREKADRALLRKQRRTLTDGQRQRMQAIQRAIGDAL
jgi:hypothetical protein